MWSQLVTKEDFIKRKLGELKSAATRKSRGTDEQEYLIRDLDNIAYIAANIERILADPKTHYTEFEVEMWNLNEFSAAVKDDIAKLENEINGS